MNRLVWRVVLLGAVGAAVACAGPVLARSPPHARRRPGPLLALAHVSYEVRRTPHRHRHPALRAARPKPDALEERTLALRERTPLAPDDQPDWQAPTVETSLTLGP